jgi:hypothetical protein
MKHTDADQLRLDRSTATSDAGIGRLKHGNRHTDPIRFNNTWIYTENLKNCMFGLLPRALTGRRERSDP